LNSVPCVWKAEALPLKSLHQPFLSWLLLI
jgi:hypothetical protein